MSSEALLGVKEKDASNIDLEANDIFELIRVERRRLVVDIVSVLTDGSTIELGEIVDIIADYEYDGDYSKSDRKKIYITLYQSHLQILCESGIIEEIDHPEYRQGKNAVGVSRIIDEVRRVAT